jgi:hypothetical protein
MKEKKKIFASNFQGNKKVFEIICQIDKESMKKLG